MLKRKYLLILFLVVPVLLLAMVGVQWYWIKDTYRLREIAFNEKVTRALNQTVQTLDNQVFSWNLYSKAYLDSGDMFIILRPGQNAAAPPDTLTMYNAFPYPDRPDTCFYATNFSLFDRPTLVDFNIRIENLDAGAAKDLPFRNQLLNDLSEENYRTLLDDPLRLSSQLSGIDTILTKALQAEGLESQYRFAVFRQNQEVIRSNTDSLHLPDLLESPFQGMLFANRPFIQPYNLYLSIANKESIILRSMTIAIGLSTCLVLGLFAVFTSFFVIVLRQKRLSEMKTDFINNMTHEFMTPVTNIGLALETIERNNHGIHDSKRLMSMIVSENNHLRENINKVLHVAAMDKGSYDTQVTSIDLEELLVGVAKTFELSLLQLNGQIKLDLAPGAHTVHADETHMINLFSNIIDNCIKYHVPGRPPLIHITSESDTRGLKISIADNGKGMNYRVQRHAFNRFYRGTSGNTHDVKGFGLGLNYVKAVAETYRFEIELKSILGMGTTFTLWLK